MKPVQITQAKVGEWVSVEVSSASPFNSDSSCLLLQHNGGLFGLYGGDGRYICDTAILHNQEPRWLRQSPAQLLYLQGNELRMLRDLEQGHTREGFSVLIHEFPEYAGFLHQGESDISADGDRIALAGIKEDGSTWVFVYSLKDGKGPETLMEIPFDGLKIVGSSVIVSREDGIYVID